jgi:hypothetical protein
MSDVVPWRHPRRAYVDVQPSPEVAAIHEQTEMVEAQLQGIGRAAQRALYEQSLVDMYRQRADQVDPDNTESHRLIALAATSEFTRAITGSINRPRCPRR